MKLRHLTGQVAAAVCIMAAMPVLAEDANPTAAQVTASPQMERPARWTFDDCIRWATENNIEVRQNILSQLESDENIKSAKDEWLPSVGFSTAQTFGNTPWHAAGQNANVYSSSYNISANWTAWDGNVRKYRTESARILKQQQEIAGQDVEKTLKLGILQAYLNILYAREAVTIAEQTLEVSKSQTERARKLTESGRSSAVDLAQIESQNAQDQYNLVQAQNNLSTAKLNLKKILELGLDSGFDIADITFSDSEITESLPSMADTYAAAMSWVPELRSNELSRQIYANDVKIAKAGMLPTISLNAGVGTGYTTGRTAWGTQMKTGFGENVGVTISVPIFDGNKTKRAVAKARLEELNYELNRENLLQNLTQTIESLYIEADNARSRYASSQAQVRAAEATDQLTNRQFDLGLVNPLELLTAHTNLLNARLEMLNSKYMALLANKTIMYYATQNMSL